MNITMIGSGYVGLVSGACLAEAGHKVICVDKSNGRIVALRKGEMPIYEPGLSDLIVKNAAAGRIGFTEDLSVPLSRSGVVFIAVGTPQGEDGHADLSAVFSVAHQIARHLVTSSVVVIKSTVPVGTGDKVEAIIRKARPNLAFHVVSNPEFLREGSAIADFQGPDRVVIGCNDRSPEAVMRAVYEPVVDRILFMDRRSSELTKYAANAFLAMKITFVNEMADLCEAVDADIMSVQAGIGTDRRIGPSFLQPGPGYGGSCFPKDTMALVRTARDAMSPLSLVDATIAINNSRKRSMGHKVIAACDGDVKGKVIAILGLTFKPGTDDVRDSPAIDIIGVLQDAGAKIKAHDPKGMKNARECLRDVEFCANPMIAAHEAEAIVVVTDWPGFEHLDLIELSKLVHDRVLVDLRNIVSPADARAAGFTYHGIGRPATPR